MRAARACFLAAVRLAVRSSAVRPRAYNARYDCAGSSLHHSTARAMHASSSRIATRIRPCRRRPPPYSLPSSSSRPIGGARTRRQSVAYRLPLPRRGMQTHAGSRIPRRLLLALQPRRRRRPRAVRAQDLLVGAVCSLRRITSSTAVAAEAADSSNCSMRVLPTPRRPRRSC